MISFAANVTLPGDEVAGDRLAFEKVGREECKRPWLVPGIAECDDAGGEGRRGLRGSAKEPNSTAVNGDMGEATAFAGGSTDFAHAAGDNHGWRAFAACCRDADATQSKSSCPLQPSTPSCALPFIDDAAATRVPICSLAVTRAKKNDEEGSSFMDSSCSHSSIAAARALAAAASSSSTKAIEAAVTPMHGDVGKLIKDSAAARSSLASSGIGSTDDSTTSWKLMVSYESPRKKNENN